MAKPRYILVVSHVGETDALDASALVCRRLAAAGVTPVLRDVERDALAATITDLPETAVLENDVPIADIEAAIVVGGDGTILRAAEVLRGASAPLIGINLGHVGFLAESERDSLEATVDGVLAKKYDVDDRLALEVRVKVDGTVVHETWALNEATIEKAGRERMLDVVLEVDRRPLTSFGCDGIIIATPTGSTAYAMSAGGPIVWPSVDAFIVVPMSAHALFSRPLVVGADSVVAVELLQRSSGLGVLWCDGRRTFDLPENARVIVKKSAAPVRLARLHEAVFTDRLVEKFDLPVHGWRGPAD